MDWYDVCTDDISVCIHWVPKGDIGDFMHGLSYLVVGDAGREAIPTQDCAEPQPKRSRLDCQTTF